jgi:hypothetical protein
LDETFRIVHQNVAFSIFYVFLQPRLLLSSWLLYDEKNVQTYKHEISSEGIIDVENERISSWLLYDEKNVQTYKHEISREGFLKFKFLKFSCFYCDEKIQSLLTTEESVYIQLLNPDRTILLNPVYPSGLQKIT